MILKEKPYKPIPLQDLSELPDKRPVRIKKIRIKSEPMVLLMSEEMIIETWKEMGGQWNGKGNQGLE